MSDLFWANKPSILIDKEHLFELIPNKDMVYEEKLNAVARLSILLTVLGYIVTRSHHIIFGGIISLLMTVALNLYYKKTGFKILGNNKKDPEGFSTNAQEVISNPITLKKHLKSDFYPTTPSNPYSNVLLTDIQDNPNKKPAPPAYQQNVYGDITKATKEMVKETNDSYPNIDKKLFNTLGENFDLDLSQRQFFSTANTKVGNDQGAFAQFLYGNMPSCKDGDVIQCSSNTERYNLY
tara:strand:+ start:5466 stop:6176 length:711 start_codon:yes stop_codon:yes gene_type:complete